MQLDYSDIMALQEKVANYREQLRCIISTDDENGHRKLNPIFFLSGEIAAYKLLCQWYKSMLRNEDFITKDVVQSLQSIEALLDYRTDEFSIDEVEEGYETHSQLLWYELFQSQYDDSIVALNKEIIQLFFILQLFREAVFGDKPFYDEIYEDEAENDAFMGEVYSLTHAMIMKLPQNCITAALEMTKNSKLYKLHFDMFQ